VVTLAREAAGDEAPAGRSAPRPATKRARIWWLVHQWAGLKLSLFMSFILLTGTLAVLSHEMDWLMRPAMRVNPATVEGPPDWATIARNAAATHPDYRVQSIEMPVASAFAAQLMVEKPDGTSAYLYAHPTTGEIQGEGHWIGAARVLRNMHRHLNLPVWIGVPLVSSLAFLLLVSLVTSLVVYKKWWRGFRKPIRTRDARTAWGDFHRLAGVWSLWFVGLMIITGIWYFAEETFARAPNLPAPPRAEGKAPVPVDLPQRLERALAAARQADPDLQVRGIRFPDARDPHFKIEGQKSAILVRQRANAVYTDLEGQPVLVADARDLSVHQRISEAADPLHFGNFGSYWTKIPWFLFGLLLTALSVSGVALYAMRLAHTKQARGQGRRLFGRAWSGMGHWRWVALAAVATGFVMLPNLWTS
jgi:uncharacterized iron-regulated membrane protein